MFPKPPTEIKMNTPGGIHGFMNAAMTDLAKNYFEERKQVFLAAFAKSG
jgi:hypothetical protein